MSYIVLARKYRPQIFEDLVGQEHICELLTRAILANRIAHAYLFCGPRGVGKTSCARILAKSLNCSKGPTLKPCGECTACKEITGGTSFDVLEIDGASNRGIDEIRALRENVKFAPSYGQYKIYIVDEVHMLTTEAFNALLKTLEEPPAHVKFIFATTAPNKVPATIISRCQRFDFKRISLKTIVTELDSICQTENLKVETEAFYAIAKAAQGGLRDALSILDQLSALSDRTVAADDVFSMLGVVETELLFELANALADKNCVAALETLEKILTKGKDIRQLTKDLTEHFRNLMIVKIGGKTLGRLVDYPVSIKEMLLEQSAKFTLKEIIDTIETLIDAQETARITESAQMALEMALAKLTAQGSGSTAPLPAAPKVSTPIKTPTVKIEQPVAKEPTAFKPMEPAKPAAPIGNLDLAYIKRIWDTLTYAVSREKMSVATYLQDGIPIELKGQQLTIGFPLQSKFQKESLESADNKKLIEKAFMGKLNQPITIQFVMMAEEASHEEEENVKAVLDTFQGKVVSRWHNE